MATSRFQWFTMILDLPSLGGKQTRRLTAAKNNTLSITLFPVDFPITFYIREVFERLSPGAQRLVAVGHLGMRLTAKEQSTEATFHRYHSGSHIPLSDCTIPARSKCISSG